MDDKYNLVSAKWIPVIRKGDARVCPRRTARGVAQCPRTAFRQRIYTAGDGGNIPAVAGRAASRT